MRDRCHAALFLVLLTTSRNRFFLLILRLLGLAGRALASSASTAATGILLGSLAFYTLSFRGASIRFPFRRSDGDDFDHAVVSSLRLSVHGSSRSEHLEGRGRNDGFASRPSFISFSENQMWISSKIDDQTRIFSPALETTRVFFTVMMSSRGTFFPSTSAMSHNDPYAISDARSLFGPSHICRSTSCTVHEPGRKTGSARRKVKLSALSRLLHTVITFGLRGAVIFHVLTREREMGYGEGDESFYRAHHCFRSSMFENGIQELNFFGHPSHLTKASFLAPRPLVFSTFSITYNLSSFTRACCNSLS